MAAITITLPWPPSSLSGHNKGHWRGKSPTVAAHRKAAERATVEENVTVAPKGDIRVHVRFVPPDRRGDRTNFPNRIKPVFDGIADALKVNDARFLPSYEFAQPEKPGRIEVTIGGEA